MSKAKIVPTLGRVVYYVLSQYDIEKIGERQVHLGAELNLVAVGQIVAADIVAVHGITADASVNLKLKLDGQMDFWVTSRVVSEEPTPGYYHWMPYQVGQAAKHAEAPKQESLLEAPRIMLADLTKKIKNVEFEVFAGRLTVCVITLENGFLVTGESSCVSAANFDEKLGQKHAYERAVQKVWELEGYLLRESQFLLAKAGV